MQNADDGSALLPAYVKVGCDAGECVEAREGTSGLGAEGGGSHAGGGGRCLEVGGCVRGVLPECTQDDLPCQRLCELYMYTSRMASC